MTDQALRAGGPVDVGPGPGEEPPRKRSRQEDHEVNAQHQVGLAHGIPHYASAAYGGQFAPPDGTLEQLLHGGEGEHSAEAHAQAIAQAQAQMQAAAIVAAQQQQQQAAAVQHAGTGGATPEGSAPGSEPVGFTYRNRSRRKATEKPVGSSQIRQSFSKRKRGIAQKAFQLYKITDAKVFLFCANEKGASWAYATPGFGASLAPGHLKMMRQMANPEIDEANKEGEQASTSVMPHPPGAENEPDDRAQYVQDPTYVEDADGNQVPTGGAGEDGTAPEMWPTHAADAIQAVAQAAALSQEHQHHGGYEHPPVSGVAQELHNGENLHFIADAAASAAYLGEHGEHPAQHGMHGQEAPQHQPNDQGPQAGEYPGATALGAPMDAPPDGAPAIGVPSHMQQAQDRQPKQ